MESARTVPAAELRLGTMTGWTQGTCGPTPHPGLFHLFTHWLFTPFFVLAVIPNIPSGHVLFWTEIPLLGWERVVLGLPGTS